MEDKFEQHLKGHIRKLPEIDHNQNLWGKIDSQLSFEDRLDAKNKELTEYNHRADLWYKIEHEIDKPKLFNQRRIIYIASIAASILLLIGLNTLHNYTPDFTTSISTEYEFSTNDLLVNNTIEQDLQLNMEQMCLYASTICSSAEFEEIKTQLVDLDKAIIEVNSILNKYGESESLVKRLIAMENEKVELMNELISMVKS